MRFTALVLFLPVIASAQSLDDGTYDVYNQDITAEGKLEGCSLVFTGLVTDTAYLAGQQVIVNGSIAVRTLGKKDLLFTGKLGSRPMLANGTPSGVWQAPVHFHFESRNGTTAGEDVRFVEAETPGYRLLLGRATVGGIFKFVMDLPDTGEFIVGFNRKSGGQDVRLPIKINVALRRSPSGGMERVTNNQTLTDFSGCISRLVSDLADRIRGTK